MKYPIRASLPLAMALAVVVVAVLYVLQRLLLPDMVNGVLHRIVWGNLISPVILGLFFVAILLLWSKRRQLNREQQLSRRFLSDIGPRLIDGETRIEDVTDDAAKFRDNLVLRRWDNRQTHPNIGSHDLDRQSAITESEHLINSFAAVRFFVWALPIVGFIGTVWGIGLSISYFSETMSSSQAGASVSTLLQQNIPLVTKGLSTAFDTTLLALVLSVPATGCLVLIERSEREYLLDLDEQWRQFIASRPDTLDELNNLDIDLEENNLHAQAVDESLRELREEAFDRYQHRLQSGE